VSSRRGGALTFSANAKKMASSVPVDDAASATVDAMAGATGALLALLTTYPLMTLNARQHTDRRIAASSTHHRTPRGGKRRPRDDGETAASSRVSSPSPLAKSSSSLKKVNPSTPRTRASLDWSGTLSPRRSAADANDGDGVDDDDASASPSTPLQTLSKYVNDNPVTRSNAVTEMRALVREEGGVGALYRGIKPAIVGTVASQSVYNFFYSALRTFYIKKKRQNPGALSSLAIASCAGSINVVMTIPIWTIVTKMQTTRTAKELEERQKERSSGERAWALLRSAFGFGDRGREAFGGVGGGGAVRDGSSEIGFRATARGIYADAGVRGFWQGVVPALVMVSNPALQYAFYESAADRFKAIRARARRRRGASNANASRPIALTAAEVFVAGALAKIAATLLTYPVLLVKSRLQASSKSDDSAMRYDGTIDALRRIVREEGYGAFYRGMGTKMTQTVFASALMFAAKEEIVKATRIAHAKMLRAKLR
jgi:adenine nucleotide transporter 17